jgi:hypothetical protein
MKLVIVLEFEVEEDQVQAVSEQVMRGMTANGKVEPMTSARREAYIAIRESADAVLAAVKP